MTTVVLVHERFTDFAGSEAVVAQMAEGWPDAVIRTPIMRPGVVPVSLQERVSDTYLSKALRGKTYAHLLPVLPGAFRKLQIPAADVVVASHHAFANQVVYATDRPVVSYVHSPARWVWDADMRKGEVGGLAGRAALSAFSEMFKPFDKRAAARVHTLVANSSTVASRINMWWGLDARVIHPPVDTKFYTPAPVDRENFFLIAGRLVAYKRPHIAVAAAKLANVPIVVVGEGRNRDLVERAAGARCTFLGRVSDEHLRDLYRRCSALLMPGEEDFGIVPVEAQSCGSPVVSVAAGGALDTVMPGTTGTLIPRQSSDEADIREWADVLRSFSANQFDSVQIRNHAMQFSRERFREQMLSVVAQVRV